MLNSVFEKNKPRCRVSKLLDILSSQTYFSRRKKFFQNLQQAIIATHKLRGVPLRLRLFGERGTLFSCSLVPFLLVKLLMEKRKFSLRGCLFYGGLTVLALALMSALPVWYFCLRAVPLRISAETTYITEPLTADGKRIDYFLAMENLLYSPEMKTDDNAYRMILRSFGLPKDDSYSDTRRRQFYDKLGLDFEVEPTHTIKSPLWHFGQDMDVHKAYEEACKRGFWTLDEFPQLADWLSENSDSIDLLAEALRKPVFRVPIVRENEASSLTETLNLPHVQQCREFARTVAARAYYRLGIGDIDGAIEDTLTAYRLGRHVAKQGMLIQYLVGIAIEGMAQGIPLAGNPDHPPTKEQLTHFLREFDRLPLPATWQKIHEPERLFGLGTLQEFLDNPMQDEEFSDYHDLNFLKWTVKIFDANVMFEIHNQAYDRLATLDANPDWDWKTAYQRFHNPLRYLTVQSRTEQVANALIHSTLDVSTSVFNTYQRFECIDRLKRLMLALLLYEAEHGSMPGENWAVQIESYLTGTSAKYLSCPSNPAPEGMTNDALVQYGESDDTVAGSHGTILLVELSEAVPLNEAVVTVDEVLARQRVGSSHPSGMNVALRRGAVRFLSSSTREDELRRLLGRE